MIVGFSYGLLFFNLSFKLLIYPFQFGKYKLKGRGTLNTLVSIPLCFIWQVGAMLPILLHDNYWSE